MLHRSNGSNNIPTPPGRAGRTEAGKGPVEGPEPHVEAPPESFGVPLTCFSAVEQSTDYVNISHASSAWTTSGEAPRSLEKAEGPVVLQMKFDQESREACLFSLALGNHVEMRVDNPSQPRRYLSVYTPVNLERSKQYSTMARREAKRAGIVRQAGPKSKAQASDERTLQHLYRGI